MAATPASSPRKNPNCRNSELMEPFCRGFSGNPFAKPSVGRILDSIGCNPPPNTPVTSPSGLPRRHSISRVKFASLGDFDDKENSKDQNESRPWRSVRSPVSCYSKAKRKFMSPTISAASKITASPRKDILVERNGSDRSSLSSFSVEGLEDTESRKEVNVKERNVDECSLDCLKCGVDDDSKVFKDESTTDEDLVNLDPAFKISPKVSFSPIVEVWAPIDADQSPSSVPPYDPKANYLSPRPQFLRYKPKHKNKLHIGKKGPEVEESVLSGSSSETDVAEESKSEDLKRELELETASSNEVTEENEAEEELHVSEPAPVVNNMAVESVEAKRKAKPASFSSPKFIALLIALAFTYLCISSSDLATFAPPQFEGLSEYNFQIPTEVSEIAKAKFDHFIQRLQYWFADARYYVLKKISGLSRKHVPVPIQYADLSNLPEYNMIDTNLKFNVLEHISMGKLKMEAVDTQEATEKVNSIGLKEGPDAEDSETDSFVEAGNYEAEFVQAYQEAGVYEKHDAISEEQAIKSEEEHRGTEAEEIEVINHPTADQIQGKDEFVAAEIDIVSQGSLVLEDQLGGLSQAPEMHSLESKPQDLSVGKAKENVFDISFSGAEVHPETTEHMSEAISAKFLRNNMLLFPLLVLLVIMPPVTTLAFLRKGEPLRTCSAVTTTEQPLQTKTYHLLSKSTTGDHRANDELPQTNFDRIGKYYPSEMSSSKSSLCRNGPEGSREAQSQERRLRGSLAHSDFSSYGSFTTYERIPNKHGGHEEIATPVRRSSRIRNQIASS